MGGVPQMQGGHGGMLPPRTMSSPVSAPPLSHMPPPGHQHMGGGPHGLPPHNQGGMMMPPPPQHPGMPPQNGLASLVPRPPPQHQPGTMSIQIYTFSLSDFNQLFGNCELGDQFISVICIITQLTPKYGVFKGFW